MHSTHLVEKKGPPVRLRCILENQKVVKTTLEHFPFFEVLIEADPLSSTTGEALLKWLHQFSRKKQLAPFPLSYLDLDQLSPFQKVVLAHLSSIPFGEVASYKEVAQQVGNEKAARAVGSACGRNPFPLLIPCHRVIAGDGSPGGFSLDFRIKLDLLAFESSGIKLPNRR